MTGEELKKKLQDIGISQTDLASKLGLTKQNLQNRFKISDVGIGFLQDVAVAVNKNVYELLDAPLPLNKEIYKRLIKEDSRPYSKKANIIQIDAKAAAGLPGNLDNPVFYKEFPAFTLPGRKYQMGKFICLQIEGDSMHPTIKNNEWVIGQEIEDLNIKNGYVYLVVTRDSVLCKRLYKKKDSNIIELISDNDVVYTMQQIAGAEILRIFEAVDKITNDFRNWNSDIRKDISELRTELSLIRQEVFKNKR